MKYGMLTGLLTFVAIMLGLSVGSMVTAQAHEHSDGSCYGDPALLDPRLPAEWDGWCKQSDAFVEYMDCSIKAAALPGETVTKVGPVYEVSYRGYYEKELAHALCNMEFHGSRSGDVLYYSNLLRDPSFDGIPEGHKALRFSENGMTIFVKE